MLPHECSLGQVRSISVPFEKTSLRVIESTAEGVWAVFEQKLVYAGSGEGYGKSSVGGIVKVRSMNR